MHDTHDVSSIPTRVQSLASRAERQLTYTPRLGSPQPLLHASVPDRRHPQPYTLTTHLIASIAAERSQSSICCAPGAGPCLPYSQCCQHCSHATLRFIADSLMERLCHLLAGVLRRKGEHGGKSSHPTTRAANPSGIDFAMRVSTLRHG